MPPKRILSELSPTDAATVLARLVEEDPRTARRAAEIAHELFHAAADVESVAGEIFAALEFIDVEDLWDHSGSQRDGGYVEPVEEAYEMCEEAIDETLEQWKRCRRLGRIEEAKDYCLGILLGLHQFETEGDTEFRDWVPDAPSGLAGHVLSLWRKWPPAAAFEGELSQFLRERCPRFARSGTRLL